MRYRIFGESTGLRVSELVLGTANFGVAWGGHGADPAQSRQMLDVYADAGGNFIDCANGYQEGQSEEILGDLLTGRREEFVLSTKFAVKTNSLSGILATGNSRQAMVTSVESSLRRLKTDRIDLLWCHVSDGVTPLEELMRGFDDLARSGKILYAGLSNFPAWRVSRAATIAELRGSLPIAGIQVEHSLVQRATEQDLIPAAQALGLGVVAYSPLGGGLLTGKYRGAKDTARRDEAWAGAGFQPENSVQRTAILDTLIEVSREVGAEPGEVAVAWVAARGSLPIIGPRTLAQLESNLAATRIELSSEHLNVLDKVSSIPRQYPYTVLDDPRIQDLITGGKVDQIDAVELPVA
ncbi:aldo/keto reductase [Rhizobium leguminosarum]|uniref:aldo/keto reductase n=1 Tax=Rhizobium leguminosarum TaxID=384 RepID=UPI0013BE1FC5|nr:aldo/keto reductase [Rhizobium leguminosarum]MCA2436765.1 aldo/keto reductase [Rhizobium leguminosarum]NEH73423.1 aldo/keto reductase [Rhizobium leguminosarum]